jgi:phage terminase large subunit-like protein
VKNELEDILDPYSLRAYNYALEVGADLIPSSYWTKLSCRRFIEDLQRTNEPWHYDPNRAYDVCAFIEELPHVKGIWAKRRETIKLEDWQCFILCVPFGFVYKHDYYDPNTGDLMAVEGSRRFRTVYIEVPRKNAKTTLAAGVALYLVALDSEEGPEVYAAACSRDQAKIVWKCAKDMLLKKPELLPKLTAHAAHITNNEQSGIFEPLHAESGTMDGKNTHASVNDELHAWKKRSVYDVIETSLGSRTSPMMWNITTSGVDVDGVCYDKHLYLKKTLESKVEDRDDTFFGIIYTIDEGDNWLERSSWQKANPNYAISVSPLDIQTLAKKAEKLPSSRLAFLTKRLNVWQSAGASWLNLTDWDRCGDPTLNIEQFYGEPCWLGNDHASKKDITAQARVFEREIDGKRHIYAFMRYYLPEQAVKESLQQYDGWVRRGLITQTNGASFDVDIIERDTLELSDKVDIQEIAVDPGHNSTQYSIHMEDEGFTVVDVRPSTLNFSEPMKWLEAFVAEGRFHFDGDPVLTWMIGNTVVKPNHKDEIYPRKLRDANKIDGVVALIMAINRLMATADTGSIYDSRGVLGAS